MLAVIEHACRIKYLVDLFRGEGVNNFRLFGTCQCADRGKDWKRVDFIPAMLYIP